MTTPDMRARLTAAAVLLAVSLVCTQVPLLNYFGFEYSVLMAFVASLVSGLMHLSFAARLERGTGYTRFLLRSLRTALLLLVIPIGVSILNALVVQNCSLSQGFVFFLLLVPPAVFFSVSLATLIVIAAERWRKTWFVAIVFVLLLHVFYVTVTRPQIFAFNHLLGFFPGLSYDETLRVEGRLVLFRLETVLAGVLMLGLGRIAEAIKRRPLFGPLSTEALVRRPVPRWWIVATVAIALGWGWMVTTSEELGLSSSASSIAQDLGGRIEGEHVVVVYAKAVLSPNEAQRLLDLHEFLYEELARDLRVAPRRKITSFVYPSAAVKGRLVGAANTNIAKPWLWQLHINLEDVDAVLKHELVHVMGAEFGFVLFRVGLNPGLIEGLAVALERKAYGEPLHRLARSVELLGMGSTMEKLFSVSGFLRSPPSVSYTLAGSFSRFLIDRYGMRRFKRLYRSGDFDGVYRKPLGRLQREWRAMLQSITPSNDELEKAAYLFERPSIFGKVCVRVIANLNDQTRNLLARGSLDSALEASRRSLELTETPEAILLHASTLFRLGRYEDVVSFAEGRLGDSNLVRRLLPLRRTVGTAEWVLGEHERARRNFDILKRTRISLAWAEDAALRLQAMGERSPSSLLPYFTGSVPDSEALAFLRDLRNRKVVRASTIHYLLALAYERGQATDSALTEYARASFNDPILEFARIRRMALAEFATGKYQKAKMHFWEARNHVSPAGLELELDQWIRRCDWMTEKAREDPFTRTLGPTAPRQGEIDFRAKISLVGFAVLTNADQPRSPVWQ